MYHISIWMVWGYYWDHHQRPATWSFDERADIDLDPTRCRPNSCRPDMHSVATRRKRGVSRYTFFTVHDQDWVLGQLLSQNRCLIYIGSGLTRFLFLPLYYRFERGNLSDAGSRRVRKNIRNRIAQKIGKNHIYVCILRFPPVLSQRPHIVKK